MRYYVFLNIWVLSNKGITLQSYSDYLMSQSNLLSLIQQMINRKADEEGLIFTKLLIDRVGAKIKKRAAYSIEHELSKDCHVRFTLTFPFQRDFEAGSLKFMSMVEKTMKKLNLTVYDMQGVALAAFSGEKSNG